LLFTGHAELNIDAKGRLAIPAKYRSQWDVEKDGPGWYCVPWPDGSLRVYTEQTFQRLADRDETSLTPDPDVAELEANFFGSAERVEMDSAGRITLPKLHVRLTGLPSEVVVVGARNRMEIRDRESWLRDEQARFNQLPALVTRVESRKRSTP